ncbi:glycoside hydrolase family 2 protein [Tenggerimyces flavus]|uniref:Glycoside hydrolase family 2 TIM barrel-domain containing protein n=1 Tax=Tenggerimyces flavus TaxID=1708749 RepID=A0ABV7Y5N6_9ACTN|nr:glycoside hydrolase family 2 TIM barrel-domain containing protein [Tenggerimyces flavus]MBM7785022.1 beta-galactosidase [Tenggerimyces flavus]
MELTSGWLFEGAPVTLPHTVAPLSWRDWEPSSWEGVFTYERSFDLPADFAGRRVFLDVAGAMTSTRTFLNGTEVGTHRGGYLPFSHELTPYLRPRGNALTIEVDATWQPVPPNGHELGAAGVDYFQPGGLYRSVALRAVPPTFVSDVWARPLDVLDAERRRVEVEATLDATSAGPARLVVELHGPSGVVSRAEVDLSLTAGSNVARVTLDGLTDVELWDLDRPRLYEVRTLLGEHEVRTRIGFRQASFENDGFYLNGRRVQLFGLNRHQLYPYAGMAMPDRVQREDARILREELNCTMVRCAHYPQSPAFLDACDELGLLVFEEIPGWQHVGDAAWQDLALGDVEDMIRRDRNRPSVVVWGVRVNESELWPELYDRTQALAKRLDPDRQTSGAMLAKFHSAEGFAQDVFAYNCYAHDESGATLKPPLDGIPFLVTEAIGSLAGPHFYRRTDPPSVQARQAFLHAQVHDQAARDPRYAGVLAWQAFDYDSMNGWVDHRLKCNGVGDTFRIPKLGAAIYAAQVSPAVRPVIAPAFHWDPALPLGRGELVCSNCDRLELYVGSAHVTSALPDRERFPSIAYAPSFVDLSPSLEVLRIDGYVGDRLVLTRHFSADVGADVLSVAASSAELVADGADATRVVIRAVDRYGNVRTTTTGEVSVELRGPAVLVGDPTFALEANGGAFAVWVRSLPGATGPVAVTARHPRLGVGSLTLAVTTS